MNTRILFRLVIFLLGVMVWTACEDNDDFTSSPSKLLTFSTDTVKVDTTFSLVPTPTKTLWVYNRSGKGLRCSSVRLLKGNQTGFRVNVDGFYLGASEGYQVSDVEIRNKDSIRVFVELTAPLNQRDEIVRIDDDLVFTLESGVQQKVHLRSWSWDAEIRRDWHITGDETIDQEKPIVIYGGLTVDEGATLTINGGTTLYFHNDAGLDVHGTLKVNGSADKNVVLRGDRIDHMFDYLPYDRVPGQWQGVKIHESSFDNELNYVDIHSAFNGLTCVSEDATKMKLKLHNSVIHNCQGCCLKATNSMVEVTNTELSNALDDCAHFEGGDITLNNCTLAQFYPFDSARKAALFFSNVSPLTSLVCRNTIITGYADDVLTGSKVDDAADFNFLFDHCVVRTPEITGDDGKLFTEVVFEDPEDKEHGGINHFVLIDTENLIYDFRLAKVSLAKDIADPATATSEDRYGVVRDEKPDAGAYECTETEQEEEEEQEQPENP